MNTDVSFRRLEYFVTVGETGSIAAAAERLNVSSPSVSAAIARLEEDFGIQLFVRKRSHGMVLTRSGKRMFNEVKKTMKSVRNLSSIVDDLRGGISGILHLGCLHTVAPLVFPEVRKSFEEKYPDAHICQHAGHQAGLLERIQNADLDMCLTYELNIPEDVHFEALVNLPTYVMVPDSHPLAKRDFVVPADLEKERMVLLDLPLSSKYFLSIFQLAGIKPNIVERVQDISLARSMVANEFGYSLGNLRPKSELAPDGKPLKYISLKTDLPPMRLGLVFFYAQGYMPRVAEAFLSHCREVITSKTLRGMAVE